jgi:hypothetical protein
MTTFRPGPALSIALCSLIAATCGVSPSAPTNPSIAGGPTMILRGRIVDDMDNPVQSASVTLQSEYAVDPSTPPQVLTDADGAYAMVVSVRPDSGGDGASLFIDRAGYEGIGRWHPANSNQTIVLYPRTILAPFSTVESRIVANAPYACGPESHRCRRIRLVPANRAIEVTIVASAGEEVGLVDNDSSLEPFAHARTVTTADGDVFIIGGLATVTLQARHAGPTNPLTGQYSLTLVHDCKQVPEEARTRRYTATIEPASSGMVVTLSDAHFLFGGVCTLVPSRLGCHQFLASLEQDNVRFDLLNDDEWHGGYITERVPPGTWLQVYGSAVGRLENGNIAAAGTGGVWYCPGNPEYPFPCMTSTACENANLRMTFVRR